MNLEQSIVTRRSIRGFLPDPVPRETINSILTLAALAPSGNNVQPWRVHVIYDKTKQAITEAIRIATKDGLDDWFEAPYDTCPPDQEPYNSRKNALFNQMYKLYGIDKEDEQSKVEKKEFLNFTFFHAPVALIVTSDSRLATSNFIDIGAFIQTILLVANSKGLGSVISRSLARFHSLVAPILNFKKSEILVCAIPLGFEDSSAPVNSLKTDKLTYTDFTTFYE